VSRSFNKAGSFLRLDSLAGKTDQQQQQSDDFSSDDPELGRPISRAWSRSKSFATAAAASGPGGLSQQQQQSGCLGNIVQELGVADRGGASFFTQWNVLLKRAIKVRVGQAASAGKDHCRLVFPRSVPPTSAGNTFPTGWLSWSWFDHSTQ
jgi:hypothetical protein